MGTWGIARDMAKRNEENLARLNGRRDTYKKYVESGSTQTKPYQYKEATPEVLEEIREKMRIRRIQNRKKSILIGAFCAALFVGILWIFLEVHYLFP